jgi:phosphoribosylformylglycinamidine (FGAM) synthase-like amidotransferase family enzyme
MEFPATWVVFQAEDFATADVRAPGPAGMEVMAQMRPNGRLLDHFRVVLGGSEILEAAMPLDRLIPSPNLNRWRARYQFWARDTAIRRNMTTSSWRDVYQLIHSNEFRIENEEGELVDTADVIRVLDEENKSAVIRYATTIGEDRRMTLELQSLPTLLAAVNSKPTFRG